MSDPFERESSPALDAIDFLSSSRHRVEILRTLRSADAMSRAEVRSAVDASRSTVRRTLEGFLERGWVEPTDGGYRLTAAGGFVDDAFDRLATAVRVADEYEPLLRWVPHSALDLDPALLEGGSLTVATESSPYAPAQTQTETIRTTSELSALLPSIELEGTRVVHERITSGELSARVVLPPEVARTVRSEPFAELFREKLETGDFEVYVADGSVPFYLGLPDEGVEIGGEDEEGIPRVLYQSSDRPVREWAERTFEDHRRTAERLTAAEF